MSRMNPGPKFINNQTFDKKQKYKFNQTWGKLINFCKPNIIAIIVACVLAIGGAVFTVIGPDKIGEMTNAIKGGIFAEMDLSLISTLALTLLAFYATSVILSYVQSYIMATVTQRISKRLRRDISKKINRLPLRYFDSTSTGDILSRVTNDVDTIGQTLNQSIGNLVTSIALLIGSVIMMFITNWAMALIAISASIIGFSFMGVIISKSQKYFIQQQQYLGELNGHIEEVYSGHNVVKIYNAEEKLNKNFDRVNLNLKKCSWKSSFISGLMMPLMGFVGNFGYVAVCVAGALLAFNGTISFGDIIAFTVYVRLFTQPLSSIAQAMSSLQSAGAASYRVFEFLDEKELQAENEQKDVLKKVKGSISFKNVRFGYNEDKTIIKNFSAQVEAGQKIAIVGPTGAGKTTMVNLLMRFYELRQPRLILNKQYTDYKVFNNGKSVAIKIDNENKVFINGELSSFVFDNTIAEKLPKNVDLKFDQNFNLKSKGKKIEYKIDILTGESIDKEIISNFGIAYYGDILIDDVPTKSLTRNNVHDLFCMVLQDTWMFEGTIKENIIYNKKGVTDEDVVRACQAVGIDHFINTLPDGYNTILNEEASLSAGQRQLITIARAMVDDAPMLILDEATSSVDTRTEVLIQQAMDKLMVGRTSIVIAHRLSTIKNSNLILVMKEGDIIESGNHEELLSQNGFYADLYNSQFDKVS